MDSYLLKKLTYFQKKLTPEELKEKLGKCNKLDELRARLIKATNCNDRLKAFQAEVSAEIKESKSPLQSPSKVLPSPSKAESVRPSPRKIPAHPQLKSFSHLDIDVPVRLVRLTLVS